MLSRRQPNLVSPRCIEAWPGQQLVACGIAWIGAALVYLVLLSCPPAFAANEHRLALDLPSGLEMRLTEFPAAGSTLLIWLPSKYGIRAGNRPFARLVQGEGIDYWLVDLHESYLAPTGRYGFETFEPAHVRELIEVAVARGWKRILLGGESRGAALAMQAARLWQIAHPGDPTLQGLVVFHPHLIAGYTQIGEVADFLPIARMTNLPMFVFQPELNTKFLHRRQLLEQLYSGGAPVFVYTLPGVRGGYHLRDPEVLTGREIEERRLLGSRIRRAVSLLLGMPTPARAAADPPRAPSARTGTTSTAGLRELVAMPHAPAPPLRLTDARGRVTELAQHAGEVVMVNFWASWCGPCVNELASLVRLVDEFEGRQFRVLAVNIGESPGHVDAFFERLDLTPNFDLLFDRDGSAARDWRVYAVPSTYLLDRRLMTSFGYRGALRWDRPDIVETVRSLLD